MATPVTDPTLLAQLNGGAQPSNGATPVTDPDLIKQLEGASAPTAKPTEDTGNSVTGSLKSIGSGLIKGVTGVPGMLGDIGSGVGWLWDKATGTTPEQKDLRQKLMTETGAGSLLPTSGDYQRALTDAGVLHTPQTRFEKLLDSGASMVPLALTGPEGWMANAFKYGVVPGVSSELAGQLTEGTKAEPIARIAGAFMTPGAYSALGNKAAGLVSDITGSGAKATFNGLQAPIDQAKSFGEQGYEQARNANLTVTPESMRNYASHQLNDMVLGNGPHPDVAGGTAAKLSELEGLDNNTRFTARDLVNLRQKFSDIAQSGGPEAKAALNARDALDTHLSNLDPTHVLSGDVASFQNTLANADKDYAAALGAQGVKDVIGKAIDRSQATASGLNTGANIRNALAGAAWNDTSRGFNPQNEATLQSIIDGTKFGNLKRQVGNWFGGGGGVVQGLGTMGTIGAGLGTAGGGIDGGEAGMLGGILLGALARRSYNTGLRTQGNALVQQLLERSPTYQRMLPFMAQPAASPGMLGQAANAVNSAMANTAQAPAQLQNIDPRIWRILQLHQALNH